MANYNASYTISYDATSVTYTITPDPQYVQYRVYIRTGELNGTGTSVLDKTYSNVTQTFSDTFTGLALNTTYTINCRATDTGAEGWIGGTQFTIDSSRPEDWSWINPIIAGGNINLTASEWNDFCSRINEFRTYTNLSAYNFSTATKGNKLTASIVNEAINAISDISGHGTLPNAAISNVTPISASFFNSLKNALNAVP